MDPPGRTCVDSLVACEVPLVAESSLAAVTLVWLVTVHLKHVLFERFVLGKLGVTFIAEECPVFYSGEKPQWRIKTRHQADCTC